MHTYPGIEEVVFKMYTRPIKLLFKYIVQGASDSSVGKGATVLSWGWGFESRFILWI